ncbi:MAG: DUF423 domain-containing protein [Flavobacteriaceae bacterium]
MNNFNKKIFFTASILATVTIAIGAFGAHGLKKLVEAQAIETFETGVRYQMYHVFGLFFLGMISGISKNTQIWVFRFFLFGILFFSGSIYLLALASKLPFSVNFLGPITPLGGLMFMMGWLRLGYGIFKIKEI